MIFVDFPQCFTFKCRKALATMSALLLVVAMLPKLARTQSPAPKRTPGVKGGECAACHTAKSPLPDGHIPTASLAWEDCQECHMKGSESSLQGKLFLSHVHSLANTGCDKCHEDVNKPVAAQAKTCTSCHQTSKLAALTEGMSPTNPHASPHWGEDSDCNLCHHQHAKSENYCSGCHEEFHFNVP